MHYQPYISRIEYNFSALAEGTLLTKITLELSHPGLTLVSGRIHYTCAQGDLIDLPLGEDRCFTIMSLPEHSLQATAELYLSNGVTIQQGLGLVFVPFLAGLKICYEQAAPTAISLSTLLSWSVLESEINQIQGIDFGGPEDPFFVPSNQTEIALINCPTLTPYFLGMQSQRFNSSHHSASILIIPPAFTRIANTSHPENLGYGKTMDASSLQETYHLPRQHTLAEMQSTWQMHQTETSSMGEPAQLIAPQTAISHSVKEYVQQHNLTQHNQAFDYSDAKTAGIAAGPNTPTCWNQSHQGNKTILHAGNINHTRTVQIATQSLTASQIMNHYQDYSGNYSGDILEQTAQHYSEQTQQEQTLLNQHILISPQLTEHIQQLNQSSDCIITSTQQHLQTGGQAHYPEMVNAQGQMISFG